VENCAPCDQARASLVARVIPFREVNVATQKEIDEVKKLSGTNDFPLLVVGSQLQSMFREDLYNNLLDTAGYPSSGARLPIEALRKMDQPAAPRTAQQSDAK
jgi:glutaredoxin